MAEQVTTIHNRLNSSVLPKTQQVYSKLNTLYEHEAKEYQQMQSEIEVVLNDFNSKIKESSNNINDLMRRGNQDDSFKKKGDEFLNGKAEELKTKNKNIESIISGLKETVGKIKPKELASLPGDKDRSLDQTFRMIYKMLYNEPEASYTWKRFKKEALEKEDGEDFQSRLANVDVRNLPEAQYNEVRRIKEDPEFNKLCEDKKYADKLIDLGDWMEYVCVGVDFQKKKQEVQHEYDKINREMERRKLEGKSGSESLSFWKETNQEVEAFQNNLIEIQRRLKTIQLGIDSSLPKLRNNINETDSKIKQINSV